MTEVAENKAVVWERQVANMKREHGVELDALYRRQSELTQKLDSKKTACEELSNR